MTTFTLHYTKGNFVRTGPDVEPRKFKTRREAKEWCMTHHPGSPITEIRRGRAKKRRLASRESEASRCCRKLRRFCAAVATSRAGHHQLRSAQAVLKRGPWA